MGTTLATEVVEASYGSLAPVRFQINSRAGRPNRVVASSTPAGSPGLASNPVPEVLVTDANNNNVQNAAVLFEVLAGGGTVGGAPQFSTLTDTAGKAKPSNWIFGATAGLNRLRATVLRNGQLDATVTGNPVTFDVTTIVSGTIVVYVTVYGSPRAGVTVTLSGAASRSGATLVDGSATFANLPVGQYTVAIVPPGGAFFNPTSQTVTLAANQTLNVSFDGFGAGAGRAGVDNLSLPGRAHAGMLTSSGN
jgi:hypothetical protein